MLGVWYTGIIPMLVGTKSDYYDTYSWAGSGGGEGPPPPLTALRADKSTMLRFSRGLQPTYCSPSFLTAPGSGREARAEGQALMPSSEHPVTESGRHRRPEGDLASTAR